MTYQMQSPMGAKTVINGRSCDYFAGCGYLGLQNHPAVLQAAANALATYGLANAGGFGNNHPIYSQLTQEAQTFWGVEEIRYFASGYLGNAILAQGLTHHYDHILIDESAHYSVWDGARSIGKPITPFRHCDPNSLAAVCKQMLRKGERPLLVSDGVFPISGEIAPVSDYLDVLAPYNGLICLDDAHAAGVLGENGRGTLEYFNITHKNCFACYTLSKALGSYGGVVGGETALVAQLDHYAPVPIGASLPPLPVAAAAATALHIAHQEPQRRQKLWQNVARARAGIRSLGWELPDTPVPILCLGAQAGVDLAHIQAALFEQDIAIAHSKHYTSVPEGGALRIAIFATHTNEQIDCLIDALGRLF